jgi:hypothetical protein
MKMTEKELIKKLQILKDIKPRKDWVILTKTQILDEQREQFSLIESLRLFFQFKLAKPAFASLIAVFLLFGLFSFAQNSLPGDFLYSIKKIAERGQAVFVSEIDKPQANLELANKRLEELTKIAETNQVKKLAPAINEFQASISEATKSLSRMEATSSDPVAIKKMVEGTKELGGKIQEVKSLGVVIGEEEFDELQVVSDKLEVKLFNLLISDLEKRTLTEEQEELLNEMKELAEQGKYSEALIILNTKFNKPVSPESTEEPVEE